MFLEANRHIRIISEGNYLSLKEIMNLSLTHTHLYRNWQKLEMTASLGLC